jgi:hypothetical protein
MSDLNSRNSDLDILDAGSLKVKVSAELVSPDTTPWLVDGCLLVMSYMVFPLDIFVSICLFL